MEKKNTLQMLLEAEPDENYAKTPYGNGKLGNGMYEAT